MAFLDYLPAIGGIASAWAGYQGAKSQADAVGQSNELALRQHQENVARQRPAVEGASRILSGYGDPSHPFQRAVDESVAASRAAQGVGRTYLANVDPYISSGVRGVQGLQGLADTATSEHTLASADAYTNPFLSKTYDIGVRDIDRRFGDLAREDTVRSIGQGDALSGQAARRRAALEQARAEAVGDLAVRTGREAFTTGLGEARRDQAYRQGLATSLIGAGGTGLSQAASAESLAAGAGQRAIDAPFRPLAQYTQAVGTAPAAPSVQPVPNALGQGLTAGLAAWDYLRPDQE